MRRRSTRDRRPPHSATSSSSVIAPAVRAATRVHDSSIRRAKRRHAPLRDARQQQRAALPVDLEFYLDDAGRQHFNFSQRIWLDASVQMAFTPCYTRALYTLAVNLLTLVTPERDYRAAIGATSRRAIALAERFCKECLLQAPAEAWQLPLPVLQSWLASRQSARDSRRAVTKP